MRKAEDVADLCLTIELPLLGSNQDSPDPVPLRLAPPLAAFVVWTVPSAAPSRGQVVPAPVSTPSPLGAWLGVGSEGPPPSRTCTHAVSDVVSGVRPESGVLPVTPMGSVLLVPSTLVTARSRSRIRTWLTSSRAPAPGATTTDKSTGNWRPHDHLRPVALTPL